MKIILTAREIIDKYDWDRFCEIKHYNPYYINEGKGTFDEKFELTLEEAEQIGVDLHAGINIKGRQ